MKVSSFVKLFLALALTLNTTYAAEKVEPLPPVDTIDSDKDSVDDAIPRMWVAGAFNVPSNLAHRLFSVSSIDPNNDLTKVEVEAMLELINDKSVPNSQKKIILVRYTMGDPRVTQALTLALRAGIEVQLVTDLNPVLKGDFKDPHEKFTTDFARAGFHEENSPGAKNLKALLAAGMQFFKNIFSQPVYNKDAVERVPIGHDKFLVLQKNKNALAQGNVRVFFGTNNMAPNPRFNRLMEVVDVKLCIPFINHANNLINAFKQGKEIKDLPVLNRMLVRFKKGSSAEFATTGGRFNPNDRIAEVLRQNADKFVDGILSHFVITDRDVVEALQQTLSKSLQARITMLADDRFAEIDDWGLAAVLEGVDVWSPFGKPVFGYSSNLSDRIAGYIYQKPAINPDGTVRIEKSEEGEPIGRELLHDKMTLLEFADALTAIFIGSFNLSNNFHNSELQLKILTQGNSELVESFKVSVLEFIKDPRNAEWIVPGLEATLRNAIGMVTGHTDLEIPRKLVQSLMAAIPARDFNTIASTLRSTKTLPSNLEKNISQQEREARTETLITFLDWYGKSVSISADTPEFKIRRIVGVAIILGNPKTPDYKKTQILRAVISRDGMKAVDLDRLVSEGASKLGFKAVDVVNSHVDAAAAAPRAQVAKTEDLSLSNKVMIFDWDDTVMYMPTKILLFSKSKDPNTNKYKEIGISTSEFAAEGKNIGNSGKFADYQILETTSYNSFKYFRADGTPADNKSYFKQDIMASLEKDPSQWKAPYFDKLIQMLSSEARAKNAFILTARSQSPQEILLGLAYLQTYLQKVEGKRIFLPAVENIMTIDSENTPQLKAEKVLEIEKKYAVSNISGIEFADDDEKNTSAVSGTLEKSRLLLKHDVIVTHVSRNKNDSVVYSPRIGNSNANLCPGLFLSQGA